MKIDLFCPSRERVNKLLTFICSIITTAKDTNNINLVLGVDNDDPKLNFYLKIAQNLSFVQLVQYPEGFFKERGLSGLWNQMAVETTNSIIAMVGDDMVFETPNWDEQIIKQFTGKQDNFYLVHCNDGMRGIGNKYENVPPLAVNSFIHRDYVEVTGHYVEEIEPHIFQDTYLNRLFEMLDRKIYLHDIMIRHKHFSEYGQQDKTAITMEKLREGIWDNNKLFDEKLLPEIQKEVKVIEEKIRQLNDSKITLKTFTDD
jgi:hypothetical protein